MPLEQMNFHHCTLPRRLCSGNVMRHTAKLFAVIPIFLRCRLCVAVQSHYCIMKLHQLLDDTKNTISSSFHEADSWDKKKKCSDATPKHFSSLRCWMLCHKHGVWRTNMDTEINFSSQEADALQQKAEFRRAVPQDADWCDRTLAPNKTVFFFSAFHASTWIADALSKWSSTNLKCSKVPNSVLCCWCFVEAANFCFNSLFGAFLGPQSLKVHDVHPDPLRHPRGSLQCYISGYQTFT